MRKLPGVDLHDEAVVDAHPRHLRQHLRAKRLRVVDGDRSAQRAVEQSLARLAVEIERARRRVAVIGGRRAHRLEERAANPVRREVAAPRRRVLARQCAEPRDVVGEALELRIDDGIRPIRGDDAAGPAARADRLMMRQCIERRFGRRDHFDVEALEQRARTIRVVGEALVDPVEVAVGAFGCQSLVDAEHRVKRVVEP